MMVSKMGSHALFVVGVVGTSMQALASGPTGLNATKILESGMMLSNGHKITVLDKTFARHGSTYAFMALSPGVVPINVYRMETRQSSQTYVTSLYDGTHPTVVQMYPELQGLRLTNSKTIVTAGLNNIYVGSNSRTWQARMFDLNGTQLQHYQGYGNSDRWSASWSSGLGLGTIGENLVASDLSGLAGGGSTSSEGNSVHLLKDSGFTQILFGGSVTYEYGQAVSYWRFPHAVSSVDQDDESLIYATRDDNEGFNSFVYRDGKVIPHHQGPLATGDGRFVRMPIGRWKQGRTSGKTEFADVQYSQLYGQSLAMFGPNGLKMIQTDGEKVPGLGIDNVIFGEEISHYGDTAVWTGRVGSTTGVKFLATYENGQSRKLLSMYDPLFGGVVVDFRIVPESLDQDGFAFYYRLNTGKTGIAHSNAVPEPGTLAALGLGALLLRRRKTNRLKI